MGVTKEVKGDPVPVIVTGDPGFDVYWDIDWIEYLYPTFTDTDIVNEPFVNPNPDINAFAFVLAVAGLTVVKVVTVLESVCLI